MFNFLIKKSTEVDGDFASGNQSNASKIPFRNPWEGLSRAVFYLIAAMLPVWFLPVNNIGVEFSREVSFSAIIIILFVFWLMNVLAKGELVYRKSFVNIAVSAFILIGIASAVFSGNSLFSLFFSYVTAEKIFAFFLAALMMFILASTSRNPSHSVKAMLIFIFSSAVAGILSLLQFFNFYFLPFAASKSVDFNVIGTVNGLALFYSVVLLMVLSLVSSDDENGKNVFPLWLSLPLYGSLAVFFLNLIMINYYFSWVVLLLGAIFLFCFRFVAGRKNPEHFSHKKSGFIFSVLIISILMLITGWRFPFSPSLPLEVSPSFSATFNIAKETLKVSTKNLLLGSGPATFGYDYSRFRNTAVNNTPFWSLRFNQGFSYLLTILATEGLLGFLAVILLWGSALFLFLKRVLENKDNAFAQTIFTGILALTAVFAVYPANFSLVLAYFFLAAVFLISTEQGDRRIEFSKPWPVFVLSLGVISLIFISVGALFYLEERVRAEINFQKGLALASAGDISKAISALENAANILPRNDVYFRTLAQARILEIRNTIARAATSQDENLRVQFQSQLSAAIDAAQKATRVDERESLNWRVLGSVYETIIPFIQGAENFSFGAYRRASEEDPKNPAIFLDLGRAELVFLDRLDTMIAQAGADNAKTLRQTRDLIANQAVDSFSKAIELKPDFADAHFLLAQAYIRKGDIASAIRKVEDSKNLSPFDIGIAFQLGLLYYRNNQFDKAEAEFLRAVSLNQNYSNARYFLGLIYARRNDKSKAIEEFEKIQQFNPDNQEVAKILDNLRNGKDALSGIVPPAPAPESRKTPPVQEKTKGGKTSNNVGEF